MIIRKITDELQVSGEVYSNSKAWGHEARAIWNGREVAKARARYYNRTWERYQFESVWESLLAKLDEESFISLADRYKMAIALKA